MLLAHSALISSIYLLAALVRWYSRLSAGRKRIYWTLFLIYIVLHVLGSQ